MKISVVVPAYNEEKLLPATLRSIKTAAAAFADRGWDWELIVCDNNSTDRTAAVAEAQGARVVFEPINQIARARNAGAAAANGDWLVFVDADSHPSRDLFDDAAGAMAAGKYIGGGVTVVMDEFFVGAWFCTKLWNALSRGCKWCAGSFIFCEAAAFREIGGFSRLLYVSEEIDLSKRLKNAARPQGKRLVILSRNPLTTSARKMHLYSPLDYLRLLWKLAIGGRRVLAERDQCGIWYDGRR